MNAQTNIDYSREVIREAQRLANFFVDEARLSGSYFIKSQTESSSLISNFDSFITQRWLKKDSGEFEQVEIHLFE